MYQFKEDIHWNQFFPFDEYWIKDMKWAALPTSSKAILPVIAVHCDADGIAFPSEETIAILSGLTEKTVREGIKELMGFPGFHLGHYVTNRGRSANIYRLTLPTEVDKGKSFFFYKSFIEGGNWRLLKPSSKALYPVMRCFSYFDYDVYVYYEEEPIFYARIEFKELYKDRKWDACEAEKSVMAEYSGITMPSVDLALHDLEEHNFIEPIGESGEPVYRWKVYLEPPFYYEREYLNSQVLHRYKRKNDL